MRISDWSSDVCSSDLLDSEEPDRKVRLNVQVPWPANAAPLRAARSRALSLSNAVFSQIISMSSNTHGPASVNRQIHASNIFRLVRGQKKRAVGNVDRVTELSQGDLACLLLQHVSGDIRRDRRVHSAGHDRIHRSEEHTSELQSLMRISYAVFCLKKTTHRSQ